MRKIALLIVFFVVMAGTAFGGKELFGPWGEGYDLADHNTPFEYVWTQYLSLEGDTLNAHETTLKATDPTADRTITFPNLTGNVVVSEDSTTVRYATVELTNANIKNLRATPIELAAAPGAGYILEFVGATLILDYGTNALSESDDNLAIEYNGGTGSAVTAAIETTGFIDQAVDQVAVITPATVATMTAASSVNKNLALVNTGSGEFGGNAGADTTMTVKIAYRVHATGL